MEPRENATMSYSFEMNATVTLSDVLDAVSLSDLVCEIDTDALLDEMDSECLVEWVTNNHSGTALKHIDDDEICQHVSSNISMTTLIDNLDPDDKRELRELMEEPVGFTQDELVAIRDALTLVKAARTALNASTTDTTIDNALEGVHRLIK